MIIINNKSILKLINYLSFYFINLKIFISLFKKIIAVFVYLISLGLNYIWSTLFILKDITFLL